jgi:hypothetical protein
MRFSSRTWQIIKTLVRYDRDVQFTLLVVLHFVAVVFWCLGRYVARLLDH